MRSIRFAKSLQTPGEFVEFAVAIAERVRRRLADRGNPLAPGGSLDPEFARQVREIVFGLVGGESFGGNAPASAGKHRATQGHHPRHSIEAARILFEEITRSLATDQGMAALAIELSSAITSRLLPASVDYVDVLLERALLAQRRESQALARYLHDNVAHDLAASAMQLDAAYLDASIDGEARKTNLDSARTLLRKSLEEIRSIASGLRSAVDVTNLTQALIDFTQDLPAGSPTVNFTVDGQEDTGSVALVEEVFLILREAIMNARLHSHGARVDVRLTWDLTELRAEVVDDGIGFLSADVPAGRVGLWSMKVRADAVGAYLSIVPRAQGGTAVNLRVPKSEGRKGAQKEDCIVAT